jgi:hypothetical protein
MKCSFAALHVSGCYVKFKTKIESPTALVHVSRTIAEALPPPNSSTEQLTDVSTIKKAIRCQTTF